MFSIFGAFVSLISAGLTVRKGTGAAPLGIISLMLWLLFMNWGIIELASATSATLPVEMISNILHPVEINSLL